MPVYEYECLECGVHFERSQGFSDPPPTQCPRGHRRLRKVYTPPGVVFNASGFYVTDNRNEKGKKAAKGEADDQQGNTASP